VKDVFVHDSAIEADGYFPASAERRGPAMPG